MSDDQGELQGILARAKELTSIDFGLYKQSTLARRVRARMALTQSATLAVYRELVERDAAESTLLAHALLVKTTSMFRDTSTFETLRKIALPRLFSTRIAVGARSLRAWVPACSTGEEAYSLAMCLLEASSTQPLSLSVLASDIDRTALQDVPRATYGHASSVSVPSDIRERWLLPAGGACVRVHPSVCSIVTSAYHDVLCSAFPAPPEAVVAAFDVISCRNLMIYLQPSAQEQLFARLLKVCMPGSLLVLGTAETPPRVVHAELAPVQPGIPMYWLRGPP